MIRLPGKLRDITVSGMRVRYLESGQGSPVVLFHGLGASMVGWRDNILELSQHHRVYTVDLPGHGDSEKPAISYDADSMIEFVRELVEALGHERVVLVGKSLGGGLSLLVALRYPELVSKLVLSASASLGRNIAPFLRVATLPVMGEIMTIPLLDSTGVWLKKSFYDKSFATDDLLDELRRTNGLPGAREAALKITRTYVGILGVRRPYVLTRRLRRLQIPTLLFWGADDQIIPVKHAYRTASILPQCELHVFGSCGHWVHMERADDFNRLTLEFLSR